MYNIVGSERYGQDKRHSPAAMIDIARYHSEHDQISSLEISLFSGSDPLLEVCAMLVEKHTVMGKTATGSGQLRDSWS